MFFWKQKKIREPVYRTGESIQEGDVVRIGRWDGVVEAVITRKSPNWFDYSGSIMDEGVKLVGPEFGTLFTYFGDKDLVFIRRKES